jgi:serine/threonine protein kinase
MGVNSIPPELCIITELMPRGSLYDVLHDKYEIPFSFKIKMALDVLKGLQFIHSAGFIHRDLK